jgi:hypothetical protein
MPIIDVAVYWLPSKRVPRHDADDGQRDRRHDDQRHQIALEVRDDQQVDEDQADA